MFDHGSSFVFVIVPKPVVSLLYGHGHLWRYALGDNIDQLTSTFEVDTVYVILVGRNHNAKEYRHPFLGHRD
jgi:hypothetical protein